MALSTTDGPDPFAAIVAASLDAQQPFAGLGMVYLLKRRYEAAKATIARAKALGDDLVFIEVTRKKHCAKRAKSKPRRKRKKRRKDR